jgi:hypothetical protein
LPPLVSWSGIPVNTEPLAGSVCPSDVGSASDRGDPQWSAMPVDRPTPSGPPSWPVPQLRPESAPGSETHAPGGPPPLSVERPSWPEAPHLREPEGAAPAAESRGSLSPWPPEPTWPAAPHLREAEDAGTEAQAPHPSESSGEPSPRRSAKKWQGPLLLRPSRTSRKVIAVTLPPGLVATSTALEQAPPAAQSPASIEAAAAVPTARREGGPLPPDGYQPEPPIPRSGSPPCAPRI